MPYDNSNQAHSEIYRGFHISIEYDNDPMNPRTEYDNAGTMVCFHGRYNLGDEHDFNEPIDAVASICNIDDEDLHEADNPNTAMTEALDEAPLYWLPLYLYDHSGITISTAPFSCPWDSGQVGIMYVTHETADKEWPLQEGETDEARVERILTYMRNEVKEYDHYITGQVYGFVVSTLDEDEEPDEETEDGSCWGFSGDYDDNALKAAKEYIDGIHEQAT